VAKIAAHSARIAVAIPSTTNTCSEPIACRS
jgi:hypothetical protein